MDLCVLRTWIEARVARVARVRGDERGANLVEYLLLVGLIAIAVMAALIFLGSQLSPKFSEAGSHVSAGS